MQFSVVLMYGSPSYRSLCYILHSVHFVCLSVLCLLLSLKPYRVRKPVGYGYSHVVDFLLCHGDICVIFSTLFGVITNSQELHPQCGGATLNDML